MDLSCSDLDYPIQQGEPSVYGFHRSATIELIIDSISMDCSKVPAANCALISETTLGLIAGVAAAVAWVLDIHDASLETDTVAAESDVCFAASVLPTPPRTLVTLLMLLKPFIFIVLSKASG